MDKLMPVTLVGEQVRLEPLTHAHVEGIWEAGHYDEIWTWIPKALNVYEDAGNYIAKALRDQESGVSLPFAIIDLKSEKLIGSTRFLNISLPDRGLEIGSTWLTPSVWKTSINTECKSLLLRYCFEELGCIRVQLKTDLRNENSQRAIARIGGVKEGVLRNHMIIHDGVVRHTVYFSILDSEWPQVKENLATLLDRHNE